MRVKTQNEPKATMNGKNAATTKKPAETRGVKRKASHKKTNTIAPIIAVIPARSASSKIVLSRTLSEISRVANKISIQPTRLRTGMKTRIPPTPPRVFADDNDPIIEPLSWANLKLEMPRLKVDYSSFQFIRTLPRTMKKAAKPKAMTVFVNA